MGQGFSERANIYFISIDIYYIMFLMAPGCLPRRLPRHPDTGSGGALRGETLPYRYIGISIYRDIGISEYRDIGISVYRYIGISVYRDTGISVYRYIGISV